MADRTIAFDIIARDKASSTFGKIGTAAKVLGVVGLGGVIKSAVSTEAAFSKTMNVMQATSGATGSQIDALRKLAVKLGADTQFSANEAADAMLELSKGGIKPATIEAGALKASLNLAAAGGLSMADSANTMVRAMGAFSLSGKDANQVANALAGAANASASDVSDLSQALAQGGLAAKTAGLSIQETTGILAAFSNQGLRGSDAGTSLKTFLDALIPSTEKASSAFEELGLWSERTGSVFVKRNGEFKSAVQIAGLLQNATEKLTEAEQKHLLRAAFGSDAQRAATALANEGAASLRKYTKATSDQSAAQRVADASMKGTAGALERMRGSLETAALAVGQVLAPAVTVAAEGVAGLAAQLTVASGFVAEHRTAFIALGAAIATVVAITKVHTAVMAVQAAGGLLPMLKATNLVTAATKAYAAVQWALNGALAANPVGLVIVAVAALVAGLVIAYKKSETFRKIVTGAFDKVKDAAGAAFNWVKNNWPYILGILLGPVGLATAAIIKNWDKIKAALAVVAGLIKDRLSAAFNSWRSVAVAAVNAVRAPIDFVIDKVRALIGLLGKIKIPDVGGKIGGLIGKIPGLATGGIVTRPTLAVVGEAGPEAVIPLSRAAGLGGVGGASSNQPLVVQLVLDGRVIYESQRRLFRQTGGQLGIA